MALEQLQISRLFSSLGFLHTYVWLKTVLVPSISNCQGDVSIVLYFQYPGWTLTPEGSLFMATVNDDAAGVYTCTPYNSYGSMGSSGPTNVILQVSEHSRPPGSLSAVMPHITFKIPILFVHILHFKPNNCRSVILWKHRNCHWILSCSSAKLSVYTTVDFN